MVRKARNAPWPARGAPALAGNLSREKLGGPTARSDQGQLIAARKGDQSGQQTASCLQLACNC